MNNKHLRPYIFFGVIFAAVIFGLIVFVIYQAAFTSRPRDCSALQGGAANCIEGIPP